MFSILRYFLCFIPYIYNICNIPYVSHTSVTYVFEKYFLGFIGKVSLIFNFISYCSLKLSFNRSSQKNLKATKSKIKLYYRKNRYKKHIYKVLNRATYFCTFPGLPCFVEYITKNLPNPKSEVKIDSNAFDLAKTPFLGEIYFCTKLGTLIIFSNPELYIVLKRRKLEIKSGFSIIEHKYF